MKKIIMIAVVTGVLFLGFVFSGPFIALSKLEQAIDTEDHALLYESVDFLLLRKNLKQQFSLRVNGSVTDDNPLNNIVSGITSTFINSAVDAFVTPDGFISMMQGSSLAYDPKEGSIGNTPEKKKPVREVFKDATYSFEGVNQFSVWVENKQGGKSRFVFSRYGVSWKLVDIVLPLES